MRITTLVLALCGCGGAAQYGSFVQVATQTQAAIAADAARKLAADYDAAQVRVRIAQDARDPFGRSFAAQLRKAGFAVKSGEGGAIGAQLRVRYVVDKLKGTDLLRLSLFVERRTLSRAYARRSGAVYPAGPWSIGGP